jgi:hypothetical protein
MEKLNLKGMIESVIEDISNDSSISTFIYKVQMISRYLKNKDFTQWVKNELDGYSSDAILPEYRIFSTQIIANVLIEQPYRGILTLKNHTMPLAYLSKEIGREMSKIYVRQSLIELEEMINSNTDSGIAFATSEYERHNLKKIYENSTILSAQKIFNKSDFNLIIYKFKSTLLEMFCDFNDEIFNEKIDFDVMTKKKDIDRIVNQTINTGVYVADNAIANISDSAAVGGQGNNVQISMSKKSELESIVTRIEDLTSEIDGDRTDIVDAIFSIREELGNKIHRPKFLKTAFNSLKSIGAGVMANKITSLIDSAIGIINEYVS